MSQLTTLLFSVFALFPVAFCILGFESYANDFVDPKYVLAKSFNTSTAGAQQTIVSWADQLAGQGPWSKQTPHHSWLKGRVDLTLIITGVMNKTVKPPTGNMHDYMSWAP